MKWHRSSWNKRKHFNNFHVDEEHVGFECAHFCLFFFKSWARAAHHLRCCTCLGFRVVNTWLTVSRGARLAHRATEQDFQDVVYPRDHLKKTAGLTAGICQRFRSNSDNLYLDFGRCYVHNFVGKLVRSVGSVEFAQGEPRRRQNRAAVRGDFVRPTGHLMFGGDKTGDRSADEDTNPGEHPEPNKLFWGSLWGSWLSVPSGRVLVESRVKRRWRSAHLSPQSASHPKIADHKPHR